MAKQTLSAQGIKLAWGIVGALVLLGGPGTAGWYLAIAFHAVKDNVETIAVKNANDELRERIAQLESERAALQRRLDTAPPVLRDKDWDETNWRCIELLADSIKSARAASEILPEVLTSAFEAQNDFAKFVVAHPAHRDSSKDETIDLLMQTLQSRDESFKKLSAIQTKMATALATIAQTLNNRTQGFASVMTGADLVTRVDEGNVTYWVFKKYPRCRINSLTGEISLISTSPTTAPAKP